MRSDKEQEAPLGEIFNQLWVTPEGDLRAESFGCGCCAAEYLVTPDWLKMHIRGLRVRLEEALRLQAERGWVNE